MSSGSDSELVYQDGNGKIIRLKLTDELVTIGSGKEAVLRIAGEGIAPVHCAVRLDQGKCVLKDLGSETGTFVNDQRVELCALRAGDRVRIGPAVFEIANAASRKGSTTLMREAVSKLDRAREEGKGLSTVVRNMLAKDKPKP